MPGSSPGMTLVAFFDIRLRDLATCSVRGLHFVCPLEIRGRREDRVHAAPAVPCAVAHRKTRTRAYRFSGSIPAFPAQWLYGLLRTLPGERLFCLRRCANLSTQLDASTAAPGPHDFAVRHSRSRPVKIHLTRAASIASHTLRSVTIAKRPSVGARRGIDTVNQNYGKAEYFSVEGLT